ncbi:hypothetical protein [Desulfonatronovibrio magnus]|uniref:hypothetical protein n=1 Tax=Desulfonatronovibrio magnus TaxID=698827 RepID=UPI0005EBA00F|nr:hypothetical protein [Desulfonatronovibrio magnus]
MKTEKTPVLILIILILSLLAACSDQTGMAGKYKGSEENIPGVYSQIELKDNGEGIWETEIDLVRFRWKVRGDELWLHTKTGGVITGTITADGFIIELPNVGVYIFSKQTPY